MKLNKYGEVVNKIKIYRTNWNKYDIFADLNLDEYKAVRYGTIALGIISGRNRPHRIPGYFVGCRGCPPYVSVWGGFCCE